MPAFYTDWENEEDNVHGCANDVAKEIIKLKKDNIDGLIIDLRFNGGGSIKEAAELAGLFIDAGPVAQVKMRDAKTITLKDVNRGTVYDGLLLLLVNGFSASASEMLAGTLQDYNRALIVGSPTYGKATAQVVLPMDTTVDIENPDSKKTDSYIKVTTGKLYRINGTSAQATGVRPDIVLPDIFEANPQREANNDFVINAQLIDANKYYHAAVPLPLAALQSTARSFIDTAFYFKEIKEYVNDLKNNSQEKNVSLRLADRLNQNDQQLNEADIPEPKNVSAKYTVVNNAFDKEQLQKDATSAEVNEAWKRRLLIDPYINLAILLVSSMN